MLQLVIDHVLLLRRTPCFREAEIVLVPESNLGNEAQWIGITVPEHVTNTSCIINKDATRYGILTHASTKPKFVTTLESFFASGGVSYHEQLVISTTLESVRPDRLEENMKRKFHDQLRNFRRVLLSTKSLSSQKKFAYTGRADMNNNLSSAMRDDLVMALVFSLSGATAHQRGLLQTRGYANPLRVANVPTLSVKFT